MENIAVVDAEEMIGDYLVLTDNSAVMLCFEPFEVGIIDGGLTLDARKIEALMLRETKTGKAIGSVSFLAADIVRAIQAGKMEVAIGEFADGKMIRDHVVDVLI